jgi:hypothetical protein
MFLEDGHCPRGGCSDDPGFGCAGGIALSFEDSACQPPSVGGAGAVAQRRDGAAADVLDYWWRGIIPRVRNSSPEMRTGVACNRDRGAQAGCMSLLDHPLLLDEHAFALVHPVHP